MQLLAITPEYLRNLYTPTKLIYNEKCPILLCCCVTCILSLCCSDLDVLPVLSTAFPDADETICVMANISCLVPYSFLIIPGVPFVFLRHTSNIFIEQSAITPGYVPWESEAYHSVVSSGHFPHYFSFINLKFHLPFHSPCFSVERLILQLSFLLNRLGISTTGHFC